MSHFQEDVEANKDLLKAILVVCDRTPKIQELSRTILTVDQINNNTLSRPQLFRHWLFL